MEITVSIYVLGLFVLLYIFSAFALVLPIFNVIDHHFSFLKKLHVYQLRQTNLQVLEQFLRNQLILAGLAPSESNKKETTRLEAEIQAIEKERTELMEQTLKHQAGPHPQ